MASRVFAAEWVVPVVGPPIRNGAVVVAAGRIDWLGPQAELPARWSQDPLDVRPGVMTPGLVNAHTHLQYTHFAELAKQRYPSFEQWSYAFEKAYRQVPDSEFWTASALDGARQGIAAGCTVFADVVTNDESRGALAACGVTGIEYLEEIGQYEQSWRDGARANFLARLDRRGATELGISPHAPYSLDASVIKDLVAIAADRGLRLHAHVAESAREAKVYRYGDRSVLAIYGDRRDRFDLIRRGGSGQDTGTYVDTTGLLTGTSHLAHAIYLGRTERDLLLRRGTQVALCPRSNAVLGVGPAPVSAYLAEGHEIAVGTDSLASSPSLDLMADVAELARIATAQGYRHGDLGPRLLRAATVGGARALGLHESGYGALAVGGPADFAVFDIRVTGADAETAVVLHGAGRCVLTVAGGVIAHDASAVGCPPAVGVPVRKPPPAR